MQGRPGKHLALEIKHAFQDQKVAFATWTDLQKAFDKVWKDGLLDKIQRYVTTYKMLGWITSFLDNRMARVLVDNYESKQFLLRHGASQEGVVSTTL